MNQSSSVCLTPLRARIGRVYAMVRHGTQTKTASGRDRGTPTKSTYLLVEKRLRQAGYWERSVQFHNEVDLLEAKDDDFKRDRELLRMHIDEEGNVEEGSRPGPRTPGPPTQHPLTRLRAPLAEVSHKGRPKAPYGFEANHSEFVAALDGRHPKYLALMLKHGYEEVLFFVQQKNKSWLAGDLGRFFQVRALATEPYPLRPKPEPEPTPHGSTA